MSAPETQHRVTAEELLAMSDDGVRRELIAGEVSELAPATLRHGHIVLGVMGPLDAWIRQHRLGLAATNDPGVVLARDPDTVRAPDGVFYCRGNAPELEQGFTDTVPDLALEVVSPNDRRSRVTSKVGVWLDSGVRVVWVVWMKSGQVSVHVQDADIQLLDPGDTLTCESLLPGFALPVDEIFA